MSVSDRQLDELLTDYRRDGVVRVRSLFSAEEVQQIRVELDRYTRDELPKRPVDACTYESDGSTVRNLWRLEEHHPKFCDELLESKDITSVAGTLVCGEPVLVAVETFNKAARVGSGVPYHQDNAYFCQSPPDMLTIWVAIDSVTNENGPVYYVRGSQHEMLPTTPSGVTGNSIGLATPPETPESQQFCGLLDPGDALIHHCQTIHRSEPNRSEQSRLGLLFIYRAAHTSLNPELKSAYDAANQ